MSLPADPASAAVARRFVRDVVDAWGVGELEDRAVLLTSELVTNALLHARSAPELKVRLDGGCLRISVFDRTPVAPVRKRYGKEAATGRGLLLVEAMASAWGSEASDGGKVVWFELGPAGEGRAGRSTDVDLGPPANPSDGHAPDQRSASIPVDRRRPPGGPRASTRQTRTRAQRAGSAPERNVHRP